MAKRKISNEFSAATKTDIRLRSMGRCEAHTPTCDGTAVLFHHILRRGQGGLGTIDNGLHVCNSCHAFIHGNPAISYEKGWLRRSGHS